MRQSREGLTPAYERAEWSFAVTCFPNTKRVEDLTVSAFQEHRDQVVFDRISAPLLFTEKECQP